MLKTMRNAFLVTVAIIDLLANIPYIRDILQGKSKPNIASWSTWCLINTIAVLAALAAGNAINTVILGATYLVGSLTILILGLFKGTRKYTWFDALCQSLAVVGIILWRTSHDPNIALGFAILVDVLAVFPTYIHSWIYPYEETWSTFAIATLGAFFFILLAPAHSFAALGIPIDFFVINGIVAVIVVSRRKAVA